MKKTLLNILLGAGLFFGAGNKSEAQECVKYNHDADEFPEEVICWKDEIFSEAKQEYKRSERGCTIIHCRDKDNDNFHENIRIFNFYNAYGSFHKLMDIQDFNIDKKTGLIDYSLKKFGFNLPSTNKYFAHKSFVEIVKVEIPKNFMYEDIYHPYLTPQDLYNMGIGSRIKKIINVCESGDLDEMKRVVEVERNYFRSVLRQNRPE